MTLVVETPPRNEEERSYVLDVVLGRWLGLDWDLTVTDRNDVRIRMAGDATQRSVFVPDVMFANHDWLSHASLPRRPLRRVDDTTGCMSAGDLPVIYGAPVGRESVAFSTSGARLAIDVFGSIFFMLTRYEEAVLPDRDGYGRFPVSATLGWHEGFIDRPIADAYAELLWTAIASQWPQLTRRATDFQLILSHDVDFARVSDDRSRVSLLRAVGGDLTKRRDPDLAWRRLTSFAGIRRRRARADIHDPYDTFGDLMAVSERHGLTSTFFFIAKGERSPMGGYYDLDNPWMRTLLLEIHRRGHEIGLHGSFNSFRDPGAIHREISSLREIADGLGIRQDAFGGRQHFLRWENPTTWAAYESAGLSYDTTMGHVEEVGFRAGTCRDYPVYDVRARRRLRLIERPLHVMDGAISVYMRLASDEAIARVLGLARECRRYHGSLVVLWHNTTIAGQHGKRQYRELIDGLSRPGT